MTIEILQGDCRDVLGSLPDGSINCCVTSPPYFGLRDYGVEGQLGLEPAPDEFVSAMVEVFREVRRVLRDDGTLWLNLGDSYANDGKWGGSTGGKHASALHGNSGAGTADQWLPGGMRNRRSVWTVSTKPFKGAHFATFPPDLIEPCVLAGCPVDGTVLDPFFGAGTTGLVAQKHGRNCVGIEINPDYIAIANERLGLAPVSALPHDAGQLTDIFS